MYVELILGFYISFSLIPPLPSLLFVFRTNGLSFQTIHVAEDVKRLIKLNEVVSYKFTHFHLDGIPLHPVIYKVRKDVPWNEVLKMRPKPVSKRTLWLLGNKFFKILFYL